MQWHINQFYKIINIWPTYQFQNNKIHYYYFIDKSLQVLRSGDIETNPGSMPNILEHIHQLIDVDIKHILLCAQ